MAIPQQQQPRTSGLAITSLVTSLLGLGLVAVICGHIALSQIKKSAGVLTGKGMAVAGLVIGYVTMALVMLLMIPMLFIGARAWKKGSDRASCILYHRDVQKAVRTYEVANRLKPGDRIDWSKISLPPKPAAEGRAGCPAGGDYVFSPVIPSVGELAVSCPHEQDENRHLPTDYSDW